MLDMKLVKQLHKTGCAIASVAMMANIDYKNAIKKVLPRKKKNADYGASVQNIIKGFVRLGYTPTFYFKAKNKISKLKRNSLLLLKEEANNWHAVVWDAKKKVILDPEFDKPLPIKGTRFEKPDGGTVTVNKYFQDKFFAYITIKKLR